MSSQQVVLAVLEPGAETHRAVERGMRFAAGLGLPLELLDVVYDKFIEHDEKAVESRMKRRRDSAEALAEYAGASVENISIEMRWGQSLSAEVLTRAQETNAALVVKNTHQHSILERTLLSSADWDLIRHCPAPLVLAKDRDLAAQPGFLAAIDPADDPDDPDEPDEPDETESLDRTILATAKKLGECMNGFVQPLHVLEPQFLTQTRPVLAAGGGAALAPYAASAPTVTTVPSNEIDRMKKARGREIEELVAEAGLDPKNARLIVGDPGSSLIECALVDEFDFVVMGAVARGIIDRVLIGNTAERILDRLPCDMIVVR